MAITMVTHDQPTTDSTGTAELASYRTTIKRLPVTLRPSLNGQLAEWDTLFPFERERVQEFMRGVASLDPSALNALFDPLRKIEDRMGVDRWDFSESANTMENASLLARSAYYAEWRDQVRRIYSAVEAAARTAIEPPIPLPRLIVAVLPASLPYDRNTIWNKWGDRGVELSIDGDASRIPALLLGGSSSIPATLAKQGSGDNSDLWLIDAGSVLAGMPATTAPAASLSYSALRPLTDRVLAQVNTVPKNIEATDQTLAAIRKQDWGPYWPAELASQTQLRRFVIDLYLSGNGALIFSNAFVEWAASEAIRRARPRVLIARFGMRAKPKPFTGIAIFENQQRISTLPDVDDPQGSAVDASILARYILLSAQRYPEGAQTAFLCIAESAQSVYLVVPEPFRTAWRNASNIVPEEISQFLIEYLEPRSGGGS